MHWCNYRWISNVTPLYLDNIKRRNNTRAAGFCYSINKNNRSPGLVHFDYIITLPQSLVTIGGVSRPLYTRALPLPRLAFWLLAQGVHTKRSPFCRRHFEVHFWIKCLMFEFHIKISLKFVSKVPNDNKSASAQIMARHQRCDKRFSDKMAAILLILSKFVPRGLVNNKPDEQTSMI